MYESPSRRNVRAGLAVGVVHVAIAAGFLSAFAGGVVKTIIHDTLPATWAYVPPLQPPPQRIQKHADAPTRTTVTAPVPAEPGLAAPTGLALGPLMPLPSVGGDGTGVLTELPEVHQTPTFTAVAARPLGDRGTWITPDDYPSRALREGWSGTTRLHLLVGSDGRVESCAVTASSGHTELDSVACAKVTERARFSPARDTTGAAGAGTYDGAIHWRINELTGE